MDCLSYGRCAVQHAPATKLPDGANPIAKTSYATPELDITKLWASFDPSKVMEQFSKLTGPTEMPVIDVKAVTDSQRKTFETMIAAQRQAFDGVQAFARRQAEIVRDGFQEANSAMEAIAKAGTPRDAAIKQVEFAQVAYKRFIDQGRELAEIAAKSNAEATDIITARVAEQLGELKAMTVNGVATKKADKAA